MEGVKPRGVADEDLVVGCQFKRRQEERERGKGEETDRSKWTVFRAKEQGNCEVPV